jgi:LysM repeat protein
MQVSNRIPSARLGAGLLILAAVSGCSWFHHRSEPAVSAMPSAPQTPDSGEALPVDEMTATEAATSGAGASASSSAAAAPSDTGSLINPSAPKSYVVKRGDTLWHIASVFLRDPWLWPEVWYINPQVANPHLIYPGDTLALAYGKDGKPFIRLEQGGAARLDPRLRSSPLDGAIPTIPYSAISAFLSRPSVLTNEQIRPRGVHRGPEVSAQRAVQRRTRWRSAS